MTTVTETGKAFPGSPGHQLGASRGHARSQRCPHPAQERGRKRGCAGAPGKPTHGPRWLRLRGPSGASRAGAGGHGRELSRSVCLASGSHPGPLTPHRLSHVSSPMGTGGPGRERRARAGHGLGAQGVPPLTRPAGARRVLLLQVKRICTERRPGLNANCLPLNPKGLPACLSHSGHGRWLGFPTRGALPPAWAGAG